MVMMGVTSTPYPQSIQLPPPGPLKSTSQSTPTLARLAYA